MEALLQISEQKLHNFYHQFIGKTRNVLFEDNNSNGKMGGFTDNYIRIEVPFNPAWANQIRPITLVSDLLSQD